MWELIKWHFSRAINRILPSVFDCILTILGVCLSSYVTCLIMILPTLVISTVLKLIRMRPVGLLIFGVISAGIMMRYSIYNSIWLLINIIISVAIIHKHTTVIKESKKPNRALKEDFDELLSGEWACLYACVIFVPIMFNLNHIFSTHLGTEHMNIIKFYLTLDYGITSYNFVRYGLMLTPVILFVGSIAFIATYEEESLVDLDEKKSQKDEDDKAMEERIKRINPDSFDNNLLSQLEDKNENYNISTNKENNNDADDNDIDDILDSLD